MSGSTIFDVAIATIFAREFMEGAIIGTYLTDIIHLQLMDDELVCAAADLSFVLLSAPFQTVGEFRTAILRSPDHEQKKDGDDNQTDEAPPTKQRLLKCVNCSAFWAAAFAVLIIIIVAIPLAVLSMNFSERAVEIIEGVSKVVAAIAILLLSLKIPKWLGGLYKSKKKGKISEGFDLSLRAVRFNVAWNIWREVAECGAFLLPSFLQGDNLKAIPLSAFVGIVVGVGLGALIYWANRAIKQRLPLAIFITLLLIFLSAGLFVGGCHEFEEVWGETHDVWEIESPNASSSQLPMALLKPFGYSSSRTVMQIACFWSWLALAGILHGFMMWRTGKINKELAVLAAQQQLEEAAPEIEKKSLDGTAEMSSLSVGDVEAGRLDSTATPSDSAPSEDGGEEIHC